MDLRRGFAAVILITGVAFCPAVEQDPLGVETVVQGPWIQLLPGGGYRLGVLLVPPIEQTSLAALHFTVGGETQPATVTCRAVSRRQERQSALVAAWWTVGAKERRSGPARIGEHPMGTIPPPIPRDRAVRVAIAGPRNYPDQEQLTAVATALGGPMDLVLGLGAGLERRLGLGGWETTLPLAVIAPPPADDSVAMAVLGPEIAAWGAGFDVGAIGFVTGRDGDALALAAGRSEASWKVPALPIAPWDPGVLAPFDRSPVSVLASWIGVSAPMRLPLILGGGSASGLVSEPLRLDAHGHLAVAPGGTRYLLATPAGEGLRSLVRETALGLDQSSLLGLSASPDSLEAVLVVAGEDQPLRLTWHRAGGSRDEADESGTGWGRGSGLALANAFRQARKADPPTDGPLAELLLLPRDALALGDWDTLETLALARPSDRVATAQEIRLVDRLVADPWFIGDQAGLIRRLPARLQRSSVLRWLGSAEQEQQIWAGLAARCPDQHLLWALIAAVEARPEPGLVDILVQRLQAQNAGTIEFDADPLLQSRLTAAVFDTRVLSPTPLRALARDLLGKLTTLGQQPVRRFLERNGRFRPVD